jgi:hypothetical protein
MSEHKSLWANVQSQGKKLNIERIRVPLFMGFFLNIIDVRL